MSIQPLCTVHVGPWGPDRVATLGDPKASTCSVGFARTWLGEEGGTILGYESFEAASLAVEAGDADYLVVPAAYPKVDLVIADPVLAFKDSFVDVVPPVVLIARERRDAAIAPPRLYHHLAFQGDADRLVALWGVRPELIAAPSNPKACEAALEDIEAMALTNRIAAVAYGTVILRVLAEGRPMPCVVYEKANETNTGIARPTSPIRRL